MKGKSDKFVYFHKALIWPIYMLYFSSKCSFIVNESHFDHFKFSFPIIFTSNRLTLFCMYISRESTITSWLRFIKPLPVFFVVHIIDLKVPSPRLLCTYSLIKVYVGNEWSTKAKEKEIKNLFARSNFSLYIYFPTGYYIQKPSCVWESARCK